MESSKDISNSTSDENEAYAFIREDTDLSVDKLSEHENENKISSEGLNAMKTIVKSKLNIDISILNNSTNGEAKIVDATVSVGNGPQISFPIDTDGNGENCEASPFAIDTVGNGEDCDASSDDGEDGDASSEINEDSALSDNNEGMDALSDDSVDSDAISESSEDRDALPGDNKDCEANKPKREIEISISLEKNSICKVNVNSSLSVGNRDGGVPEKYTNDTVDFTKDEGSISDKIQILSRRVENADPSLSLPFESGEDSRVIKDVPNDRLDLAIEEDIAPSSNMDRGQIVQTDHAVSLTPMQNELELIKDIIEDSSEDEALLTHQTKVADESDHDDPVLSKDDDFNEVQDTYEREKKSRSSSKDLSLPYFKLPKPDLDEFLAETEKNLQIALPISETVSRKDDVSSLKTPLQKNLVPTFLPKDTPKGFIDPKEAFITIDLDYDYSKLSNKEASKKKVHITKIDNETSSGTVKNEYEKVVSSLNKDETELPGIKRLALKEFLKKQIDQKRYEAFCYSKSLNREDEEMEEEALIEEDEAANTDDEDSPSEEEEEEATVTFENLNKKDDSCDGNDENMSESKLGDECVSNAEGSDDESDDDFIGVRKAKKKFIVLEEDEDDDLPNESKRMEIDEDDSEDLSTNDARGIEQCKSSQPAFREGDFQLHEKSNGLSQISSSMPSYQPGGGFNQEIIQEDSSDSLASLPSLSHLQGVANEDSQNSSMHYQSEENFLRKSPRNSILVNDTLQEKLIYSPKNDMHHIKLDDLPISQADNDSDIFATNELADVCSGAFNGCNADELTEEASLLEPNQESGTTPLRRLEDVLKYPPKERYDSEPESEPEPEEKVTNFFDIEAELSGEDDGVDEKDEDSEDENLILHQSDDEDLPEDEVLREEIADLHMKRLMNDDAEYLKEIQEQFLDDGELNSDGAGRSRRFAWKNNDTDIAPTGNNSDSDSDADVVDDTFSSINEEKAKWRHENKDDDNEDISEELNSSGYKRKSFLKVNIVGKPKFSQEDDKVKRLSGKRLRGSFLNLDDSSASQVLKKLKASEDNMGGSRTTKHFVFRNEMTDSETSGKENSMKSVVAETSGISESPKLCSIFNKI